MRARWGKEEEKPKSAAKTKVGRAKLRPVILEERADLERQPEGDSEAAKATPRVTQHTVGPKSQAIRVEALLRKYLGPAVGLSQREGDAVHQDAGMATLPRSDSAEIAPTGIQPRTRVRYTRKGRAPGVKSIMQVKTEQDAAIRELQHAPRTFHAKPLPLAATQRLPLPKGSKR